MTLLIVAVDAPVFSATSRYVLSSFSILATAKRCAIDNSSFTVPGKEIICQKSAYLASTPGINLEIAFQKKIAGGFFGGEGFIMQRITGQGIVFLEIDGSVVDYMLAPGQQMVIDTGYLAMMDATCSLNAETVKGGAMNMFFGGEGFFNTVVTGPGKITLQTMPKSQLAAEIASMIPSK